MKLSLCALMILLGLVSVELGCAAEKQELIKEPPINGNQTVGGIPKENSERDRSKPTIELPKKQPNVALNNEANNKENSEKSKSLKRNVKSGAKRTEVLDLTDRPKTQPSHSHLHGKDHHNHAHHDHAIEHHKTRDAGMKGDHHDHHHPHSDHHDDDHEGHGHHHGYERLWLIGISG